ncbi:dihydrofolate reductase family protein [Falsihalocynthiibacter sp. SS001]|uniref:dihydrofolate reductase family protein n=1 Tax=Falsihalocynthiibacter sp. SS001 TaxID=3349698 RepID=UPI0036D2FBD1
MTVEVFIATSIDGFIARPDGSLDWLENSDYAIEGEDYGYAAFMARVGCLLMGSGTFDVVAGFDPWPYNKPVYVMSNRLRALPEKFAGKASLRSGDISDVIVGLQKEHSGTIYLDGGKMIQSGLRAGLVDRLTISRMPVLLGEGIPLFGALEGDCPLTHHSTISFRSGVTQSVYDVKRPQKQADI